MSSLLQTNLLRPSNSTLTRGVLLVRWLLGLKSALRREQLLVRRAWGLHNFLSELKSNPPNGSTKTKEAPGGRKHRSDGVTTTEKEQGEERS